MTEVRYIDGKTVWTCIGLILVGIVIGSIWGCADPNESERAKGSSPTYDSTRVNPTIEEVTRLREEQRPVATADEALVPTTCTWAETPNGFNYTCGPAHVDPTDCNEGLVKVCVRRYGSRVCNCYPE